MNTIASPALAEYCRGALQLGLGALLQSTLLIALGFLAAAALRRRGPMMGVVVYKATLASIIAGALLSVCCAGRLTPLWHVALPAVRAADNGAAAGVQAFGRSSVQAFGPTNDQGPTTNARGAARYDGEIIAAASSVANLNARTPERLNTSALPSARHEWPAAIYVAAVVLWALGAGALLGWLAFGHLFLVRLRARSAPVEAGPAAEALHALCEAGKIERPLLLAGAGVRSPFLTGLRRPAILLPAAYATEFEAPALRAILAHELVHLAQRDCAWNLLGHVACAVGWVQPLLWLLRRRMEQASEEVCDQAVIQEHCSPREYARCLVDLAERFLPSGRERAFSAGVVPERSSLGRRVQQIVAGPRIGVLRLSPRQRAAVAAGALSAIVGGVLLISAAGPATNGTGRSLALATGAVGAGKEETVQTPRGPLSGIVKTPDGQPVPGAEVFWTRREDFEVQTRSTVKTDAAGRFRFAEADQLRAQGTQPKLVILAAGWGATFWDLTHGTGEPEIRLASATRLQVAFVGLHGQPVPGLAVMPRLLVLEGRSFGQFPAPIAQRFAARTDNHGIASLSGLPLGARLQLKTNDVRFAQLSADDERALTAAPLTEAKPIRLEPAAAIHGRILYGPTGKPAAGIRVGAQGTGMERGWGDAVTDAEGKYHMLQLRAGSYNVALDLKEEPAKSWTARAHERLVVAVGEHPESVNFTLIPGAVVTGKVLAADNGEPIKGVYMGIYGPAHPRSSAWVQGMQTGADGGYFFRVPPGEQYLYFGSSMPPPGFLLPVEKNRELTVQDGSTTTVDFRFPRGGKPPRPVQGRVVGPDGASVAGAEVVVALSGRAGFRDTGRRSGPDGAFTLEAELVAQPVTLRARQGNLGTEKGVTATAGDTVTLRLQKDVLVTLTGMVTDAAARALAGADVRLFEYTYDFGTESIRATTDDQGHFTLTGLWPDARYSVMATAEGYGQHAARLDDLRAGEARAVEPLVLQKADRSVAGHVVDGAGKPVAGVSVGITGRETPSRFQTTDREGRFRFDGVANEEVTLQTNLQNDRRARRRVPAGTLDAVLALPDEDEQKEPTRSETLQKRLIALQGQEAPPLHTVAWVNSAPRTFAQLRGKVVLIDFWGIGCGPCVAALPAVQRTAQQFAPKGVVVIGLHDASASRAQLQEFARKQKLSYPLAIDAADPAKASFGRTFAAYHVHAIPAYAVIDRAGQVAYLGGSLAEAVGSLGGLLEQ